MRLSALDLVDQTIHIQWHPGDDFATAIRQHILQGASAAQPGAAPMAVIAGVEAQFSSGLQGGQPVWTLLLFFLAGALLFIAHTGNVVLGGLALFLMGLGMGVPLLIIGTQRQTVGKQEQPYALPESGPTSRARCCADGGHSGC